MNTNEYNERLREIEKNLRIIQKEWIKAYEEILRLIRDSDTEKK